MEILISIVLAGMITFDFRSREIPLVGLVIFAALQGGWGIKIFGWEMCIQFLLMNTLLLVTLGIGIMIWLVAGKREGLNAWSNYIGSGDLLFLGALAPVFQPEQFILFLILAFMFSLGWWIVVYVCFRQGKPSIPLVSTVGICYLIFFLWKFRI